nr:DUF547 domain-containing protein [Alteromonas sp. BL110]
MKTTQTTFMRTIALFSRGIAAGSIALFAASVSFYASAEEGLHSTLDNLLSKYVTPISNGASTQVNYDGFKKEQTTLNEYLARISKVEQSTFNSWNKDKQLAFLINAYNAYTIELILTEYPDIDSIRDLGSFFSSPWKKEIAPLLGETRTLDEIEHELIRGTNQTTKTYNEPRIHFAVNCASVGCPALREEAYTGDKLDSQLEAQTKRFLADASRNKMSDDTLYLSKIFDWYSEDFERKDGEWRGTSTLTEFILLYKDAMQLTDAQVSALKNNTADIEFLNYDWALNAAR